MAQDFSVKFDDNIRKFAAEFADKLGPVLTMGMMRAAQQVQTSVKIQTTKKLKKHPTGRLLNSWEIGPIKTSEDAWRIDVFSMVPYAMIHETGGVIRPKRVKALAIPNRKYTKIVRNGVPIAPREYDPGRTKLEFAPPLNKRGRLRGYLLDTNENLAFVQRIAYTLMAHVRIKPTSYMTIAVEKALPKMKAEIVRVMNAAMVAAAKGA